MRIVALYFAHFPLQVELSADPALVGKPIIIGGYPHERKAVFDASPEAYACGVQIGMSLRLAHGLCPQAEFLPLAKQRYHQEFETVVDLIADYTSKLETSALGEVFIEIPQDCWEADLIAQIRQELGCQKEFSIAVGSSRRKFPAQVASRVARVDEVIAIPSGRERGFLKGLTVDLLPISEPVLRRLEMLGIHRMGQLADLPCQEVVLQFGTEGERFWRLARGIDSSKVISRKGTPVLAEQLEFEPPAETLDRLLAGAQILMNRLSAQLDDRWQHCRGIRAILYFAEGTLEIKNSLKKSCRMLPARGLGVSSNQIESGHTSLDDHLLKVVMQKRGPKQTHCSTVSNRVPQERGIEGVDQVVLNMDFKLATSSPADMLRHLRQRLENTKFSGLVVKIEITAENLCAEQSAQLKLLDNLPRCSGNLSKAIRQLQIKYGKSVIKKPVRSRIFSRLPEGAYCLVDFG